MCSLMVLLIGGQIAVDGLETYKCRFGLRCHLRQRLSRQRHFTGFVGSVWGGLTTGLTTAAGRGCGFASSM